MAWRPTEYLIEGELDNTTPGKVTGWMRFAGKKDRITFDLNGNCHRDIRGAKIHFIGDGDDDDPKAADYMRAWRSIRLVTWAISRPDCRRTITRRTCPTWNGIPRKTAELSWNQTRIRSRSSAVPSPFARAIRSRAGSRRGTWPTSWPDLSQEAGVPAVAPGQQLVSDPDFTHWVVAEESCDRRGPGRQSRRRTARAFAYVRLFQHARNGAEYGWTDPTKAPSQQKTAGLSNDATCRRLTASPRGCNREPDRRLRHRGGRRS